MKEYSMEFLQSAVESIDRKLDNINHNKGDVKACILGLDSPCMEVALYAAFTEQDIEKAKQYFFLSGRVSEIKISVHDNPHVLGVGSHNISFVLLSDNIDLINRYAHLKHSRYYEDIKNGNLVSCVQAIIREDWEFLKNQIAINDDKILSKRGGKWIETDHKFFIGMMERDEKKIKEAITILATKEHKKRNKEFLLSNEYISIPALGYAKLAWLKGIEVEIDNPLIPKELLPIKSNAEYWEYDFMKRPEYRVS